MFQIRGLGLFASGALIGGLTEGIRAAGDGRDFWNGGKWKTVNKYSLPNGALPYAMGGVGALSAWGLGGDPISGFWQGFGIGALNHTGGGSFDDPYQLDEVTVEAYAPKSLQDWRFPNINPFISSGAGSLNYLSTYQGFSNAGKSLNPVVWYLDATSTYNNFFDAYQGKASWGSFGYETVKMGLPYVYPSSALAMPYVNGLEYITNHYLVPAKIETERMLNNMLTPRYWGFK